MSDAVVQDKMVGFLNDPDIKAILNKMESTLITKFVQEDSSPEAMLETQAQLRALKSFRKRVLQYAKG